MELVLERVAGAAGAGAERAAALDHEAVDHPVEVEAVVEAAGLLLPGLRVGVLLRALGEADEVRDRLGGVVREQVDRLMSPLFVFRVAQRSSAMRSPFIGCSVECAIDPPTVTKGPSGAPSGCGTQGLIRVT